MTTELETITALKEFVLKVLDENKALDVIDIDLHEKSTIADYMIVASGTSSRHVASLAQKVMEEANKEFPGRKQRAEGLTEG